jgi:hypothetical protein
MEFSFFFRLRATVADVFSSKEEPAVVAVTLKDLQTKLYT